MFIRKSNSFLFPLYPDETQIAVQSNETIKQKQLDIYIPFLNSWNVCVWGSGFRSAFHVTLMLK